MRNYCFSLHVSFIAVLLLGWSGLLHSQELPQAGNTVPSLTASSTPAPTGSSQALPPGSILQPTLAAPGLVTGITLGELYTNNLTLAGSGQTKETSFITQIQPFLKSAYSSSRFTGELDYTLTGYMYSGQSQHNQVANELHGKATLTILPKHFFLDGLASYKREIINNELPSGSGQYFLTNNNANAATGILSPYWVQDIGNVGTMTLRYSHGRVVYNNAGIPASNNASLNGISNVTSNAVGFNLVSPVYDIWSWNLGYANQRLEPDAGVGVEFAAAKLGSGLQISPNTMLLADVGKENKFLPDGSVQYLGAHFWDAGFNWANSLDNIRFLFGHRYFGHSYSLSWTHVAALLSTNLMYIERPTSYNQQLLGQNPTQPITVPMQNMYIPSLTESHPYLSKRGSASIVYNGANSTLTVMLYDELRTYYGINGQNERVLNAQSSWRFNIGVFTTLTPMYGWQRYRFTTGQVSYNTFEQLALVHQFGINDFASLKLRYESSNVNNGIPGAHGYGVKMVFLQWTHIF